MDKKWFPNIGKSGVTSKISLLSGSSSFPLLIKLLSSWFFRWFPDDNGEDLLCLFRSKELPKDEWLFVLIRSSYPFDNPVYLWDEDNNEDEDRGAKDTLLPESTLSSILKANNNCRSSLWLHSSPLDPKYQYRIINSLNSQKCF